jgi:hypothetical protein
MLEPITGNLVQRLKEFGRLPVQEHKTMIHGLSIDSARCTTTAHPSRAFEQAHCLACPNEHPGTGQSRYPCANNENISNHTRTMPLASVFGQHN